VLRPRPEAPLELPDKALELGHPAAGGRRSRRGGVKTWPTNANTFVAGSRRSGLRRGNADSGNFATSLPHCPAQWGSFRHKRARRETTGGPGAFLLNRPSIQRKLARKWSKAWSRRSDLNR
jgi:hypothetical protein